MSLTTNEHEKRVLPQVAERSLSDSTELIEVLAAGSLLRSNSLDLPVLTSLWVLDCSPI